MENLNQIGERAKKASKELNRLSTDTKNEIIRKWADALLKNAESLIEENKKDLAKAEENGISGAMYNRLTLTKGRIASMAEGLDALAALEDPVGSFENMKQLPNGLLVGQKRVPFGVVGIIYESRPNVTADAAGLCLKTGNAVILRGGSEAICSNIAIVTLFRDILSKNGVDENAVTLLSDTSRETALGLMKLNKYLDVLIPRGGAGLIQSVVQNATVPIIETGVGNCHIFIDESADINNAVDIVINAKTQYPSVCNACETVLVHKNIAGAVLPGLCKALKDNGVELRMDDASRAAVPEFEVVPATEQDWYEEFLDLIIAIKTVEGIDEAIRHIGQYSTSHSEAILTNSYQNAQKFVNEVDSAAVYINASTRFTDGYQFGLGAEIGISTQKLHARGPMGLKELTSYKYVIYGSGQCRP